MQLGHLSDFAGTVDEWHWHSAAVRHWSDDGAVPLLDERHWYSAEGQEPRHQLRRAMSGFEIAPWLSVRHWHSVVVPEEAGETQCWEEEDRGESLTRPQLVRPRGDCRNQNLLLKSRSCHEVD